VCRDRGVGDSTFNFGGVCKGHFAHSKGHFAHCKGPSLISRAELKGLAIPDLKGVNLESPHLKGVNVKTPLPTRRPHMYSFHLRRFYIYTLQMRRFEIRRIVLGGEGYRFLKICVLVIVRVGMRILRVELLVLRAKSRILRVRFLEISRVELKGLQIPYALRVLVYSAV